jgi:hypothetical protein
LGTFLLFPTTLPVKIMFLSGTNKTVTAKECPVKSATTLLPIKSQTFAVPSQEPFI